MPGGSPQQDSKMAAKDIPVDGKNAAPSTDGKSGSPAAPDLKAAGATSGK